MSARAIHEYDGKRILSHHLLGLKACNANVPSMLRVAQVCLDGMPSVQTAAASVAAHLDASTPRREDGEDGCFGSRESIARQLELAFARVEKEHPWVKESGQKLVVKPDQLIKRRGKAALLLLDADWEQVKKWILEKAGTTVNVDGVVGTMKTFIVEPFVKHASEEEYYVCIQSKREGDEILFCKEGGVDVGDVDSKAVRLFVPIGEDASIEQVSTVIGSSGVGNSQVKVLAEFIAALFTVFVDLNFTYLEINPLVVLDDRKVYILDLAARLDQTAEFESGKKWMAGLGGEALEFPAPFGRELTPEEAYIAELDSKTGASLKLTILNKEGRVWTMVAGGGASVAYSDAIAALGFAHELANYGEYSGAPSEIQTYEYAKTIVDLMTRSSNPHPDGKILFIGGGIANFTNVAATFKGIIRALQEYRHRLVEHRVSIFVRRGGPNWQEGLRMMRELGDCLGVPIEVYGPDTHITAIVPLALAGKTLGTPPAEGSVGKNVTGSPGTTLFEHLAPSSHGTVSSRSASPAFLDASHENAQHSSCIKKAMPAPYELFTHDSKALVYGMQPRAVQGMLDFDYVCRRQTPSVAAMIYPFGGAHVQKFYWGSKEILLPVYTSIRDAVKKHADVDVVVNFASFRSVFESVCDVLENAPQVRTIAVIAEGVPERHSRMLIKKAKEKQVTIVGPATVGGLRAGAFKIGNTGGMIDNIMAARLYRPGSVAYVSKSGGMSNELNSIIANTTNGIHEGIAIGGDRYPGSAFIDHLMRFEADPRCKIMVLLGEVGGVEEYSVCRAIEDGKIKKPVIAWCIGVCAPQLGSEVQFGHAGALAGSERETAAAKNAALKRAGAIVPQSFEELPKTLETTYNELVKRGTILLEPEPEPPRVPIDYAWARELGLVRKPAQFVSTICDDRGQELLYAGMAISSVFKEDIGIGGVLSLLWFRRRLPAYACKFIEMVLMLTADHGPAVSGAHNTIVTARAGKDLVSSLASGLLTIGERFGGALDGAAEQFSGAFDQGLTPADFVESMRRQHRLIMGIGHKIKSRTNPDQRVKIVCEYAKKNFPATPILDYALAVENITTTKKDNLILNVDGAIGVLFVDLLRHSGAFTREEAEEYVRIGTLNGLFVLGRSLGFIGHYLDQKRLKQGLYRHPWDDISYLEPGSV